MEGFLQLLMLGLMEGGLYAIVAAAMVLVFKSTHVVSLAHGQIMGFGALAFWIGVVQLKLPLPIALLGALGFAAAMGWLIERAAMRPLIGQPLFASFLNTFAVFLVLDGIFQLILKGESYSFSGYLPKGNVSWGSITFPITQLVSFLGSLLVFFGLGSFLQVDQVRPWHACYGRRPSVGPKHRDISAGGLLSHMGNFLCHCHFCRPGPGQCHGHLLHASLYGHKRPCGSLGGRPGIPARGSFGRSSSRGS